MSKKYEVEVTEKAMSRYVVEADSPEDAKQKVEASADPEKYFNGEKIRTSFLFEIIGVTRRYYVV